jgi:hypothetical protein
MSEKVIAEVSAEFSSSHYRRDHIIPVTACKTARTRQKTAALENRKQKDIIVHQ